MRHLLYLLPTVALTMLFTSLSNPTSGHAQAYDPYRWCAQYGGFDGDGGRNCGFVTYEQCMAAISGVGGYCEPNQFYTGPIYGGPYPHERRIPKHRRSRQYERD